MNPKTFSYFIADTTLGKRGIYYDGRNKVQEKLFYATSRILRVDQKRIR